jgi:hypothetical protein
MGRPSQYAIRQNYKCAKPPASAWEVALRHWPIDHRRFDTAWQGLKVSGTSRRTSRCLETSVTTHPGESAFTTISF